MLSELDEPRAPGGPPAPVFVDRTGRRRRLSVFAGVGIGVGLLASLGLILAGLFSGSSVPVPGWPDAHVEQNEEPARTRLAPSPTPETPGPETTGARDGTGDDQPATRTSRQPTDSGTSGTTPTEPPGRRNGHGASKSPGKPR